MSENIFLETKQYKRFKEFSDACVEYKYIGICYGAPGVGKTLSAKYYSKHQLVSLARPNGYAVKDNLHIPVELCECLSIYYLPTGPTAPRQITNTVNQAICHFDQVIHLANINKKLDEQECQREEDKKQFVESLDLSSGNYCKLIIVDETEYLNLPALEALRAIYDCRGMSIIFIGMPGLEKRLSRYPQLYSRIGFAHEYQPLSNEEVKFTLEHQWNKLGLKLKSADFTDHEAMTTIIKITRGNFRLINRIFMQIDRILRLNNLTHITNEVVLSARECLLIGNV